MLSCQVGNTHVNKSSTVVYGNSVTTTVQGQVYQHNSNGHQVNCVTNYSTRGTPNVHVSNNYGMRDQFNHNGTGTMNTYFYGQDVNTGDFFVANGNSTRAGGNQRFTYVSYDDEDVSRTRSRKTSSDDYDDTSILRAVVAIVKMTYRAVCAIVRFSGSFLITTGTTSGGSTYTSKTYASNGTSSYVRVGPDGVFVDTR